MRIIGRKEFLALPPPFMYSKIRKGCVDTDELCIKTANVGTNNWEAITLNSSHCIDGGEDETSIDMVFKALKDPEFNLPLNFLTFHRDGLYQNEDEVKFAVMDSNEVGILMFVLSKLVPKAMVQQILDKHEEGFY